MAKNRKKPGKASDRPEDRPPIPCPAITKAGNACPSYCAKVWIKGKRYQLKTCMIHASPAIRKVVNVGVGRKPTPRADEILRARFEADADRYLQPLEDAITSMKALVVGNGPTAHLEYVEDLHLRLKAMETILDRIYGKPKQAVEHSGKQGSPVEIQVPSDKERQVEVAKVLQEVGALGPVLAIPANASTADPTSN